MSEAGTTRHGAAGLWRAARPRQWVKNVLVLAAPMAAGRLLEPDILIPTLYALVSFCLASSATYFFNDVIDVDEDRRHPVKRNRPIASGEVSERSAMVVAVLLGGISLVPAWLASWPMVILILSYIVLQVAYSLWLKHEPVMDLAVVASGFLLRAVAGGVATELPSLPFLPVGGRVRIPLHRVRQALLGTAHVGE